jgi:mannosyltransferase OCH1-like enzyme
MEFTDIQESVFNLAEYTDNNSFDLPNISEIQEITLEIHHIQEQIENAEKEEDDDEENEDEEEKEENHIKKLLTIPKRIFQTHKSIQYIQSKPKLRNAINSWKKFVPYYGYHFYTNEMCDTFMKTEMVTEFGPNIYSAYMKLPLAVMKADLWRYCIIYKYGGIYADVDTVCKCDPLMFTKYSTMIVCAPERDNNLLCQWCFAAPANSPILKNIIELSIERILVTNQIKGEHIVHYLTGPSVFSDGIERYLDSENLKTFKNNRLNYFTYKNQTMICFKAHIFHDYLITHLFAGSDVDGWKNERNNLNNL